MFQSVCSLQMSMWPVCTYQTLMPTWQSFLTSRPSTWASTRMAHSNLIITGMFYPHSEYIFGNAWMSNISYVLPKSFSVVVCCGQTNLQMRTSQIIFDFPSMSSSGADQMARSGRLGNKQRNEKCDEELRAWTHIRAKLTNVYLPFASILCKQWSK